MNLIPVICLFDLDKIGRFCNHFWNASVVLDSKIPGDTDGQVLKTTQQVAS